MPPDTSQSAAADFARRFTEFWTAPAPQRLDTILAAQVRLVAPMTPTTETLEDGKRTSASCSAATASPANGFPTSTPHRSRSR
ncbi:MAG: hypothetical protein WDZ46_10100 [Solirubrobacterales bacterium]